MKCKRLLGLLLASMIVLTATGCGNGKGTNNESKTPGNESKVSGSESNAGQEKEAVTISVGCMPDKDAKPEAYDAMVKQVEAFEKTYPWITITWDYSVFSADTFMVKASTGQLPDFMFVPATEPVRIIEAGYAADITDKMEEYGYTTSVKKSILDSVTRDGKIYFIPYDSYTMGVIGNKTVFEEAGELDANGNVVIPDTWDEVAELAKRIKEKTGKSGLALPTVGGDGGWNFTNIAWSYGVEFMAEENGKWVAKFDSQDMVDALQFFSDLKWKYGAVSDNELVEGSECQQLVSSGEAAMTLGIPAGWYAQKLSTLGMKPDELIIGAMPGGPAGRYGLTGGSMYFVNPACTEAQQDACFKWVDFIGNGPEITEETLKIKEAETQAAIKEGKMVLPTVLATSYVSGNRAESLAALYQKYANVDMSQLEDYIAGDVAIHVEEPRCAQDLYLTLSNLLQAVIIDKDADIKQLVSDAARDFQVNFLDNLE